MEFKQNYRQKYPSNINYSKNQKWSKNISKSPYQKRIVVQTVPTKKMIYYYNPLKREWGSKVIIE